MFYNGINYHTKVSLDSAVGEALMNKSLDEAEDIIDNVAQNHYQLATERSGGSFSGNPIKASGKFDVDVDTLMSSRLDALTKNLETIGNNTTNAIVRQKSDFETVALTEKCSALLTADTPPKVQDPGSFSIPCKISSELIHKAFCDLGASVSLFPYSLCKKLGLQNIKLTTMTLQLDDHSCRYPMGIVEDVLVEIGGCIVPIDFVVLDMEEDPKIPIILGRPFLATAGALIDVKRHKLSLEIDKERLEFDLSDSPNGISSFPGNASKSNIHKAEECSFHGRPPDMMHYLEKLERSPQQAIKSICILHE
ncbi:uncharacterized protein LOC121990997 [Zingiber officinale]|uniref:uncharacterized protein LOC121990997 n=1 Tax=Zingiber officinale TaxID=94328 RepID=UPI001C4D35BD|nr:uncharacterized protein LOC121990997 [Zingiber officinale]